MLRGTVAAVILASAAALTIPQSLHSARGAQATTVTALTGIVSSPEEGPMEGVLVSARKAGSTIATTVVTDQNGRYSFPRNKLESGQYTLAIRAVGYDADVISPIDLTTQKISKADLKLRKTQDLASQLTNTEWLMSMPGEEARKGALTDCTSCHTLQRIVKSHHDTTEFMQTMFRMSGYASGAFPLFPQRKEWADKVTPDLERFHKQAEFLSGINLSKVSKWEYPLKTLPRPAGRATHVIVTEYALPRELAQPHDVILDSEGMAWYSDFGQQFIGRLDPKTGKVTEYPVPELKPGFPRGGLDLQEDSDGKLWLTMLDQGGIARFDKATGKFQMFPVPPDVANERDHVIMVMPLHMKVDGKVWFNNGGGSLNLHRLDMASGRIEMLKPYGEPAAIRGPVVVGEGHSMYDLASDAANNAYGMDLAGGNIVRTDAKTGESKLYPTPTRNSAPRRGHMDAQDRLWFAEFRGNKVGMFDTRTEKFQEWPVPTAWSSPYDAVLDKNGEAWTAGMSSDRIVRMNPKTGAATEYLLPQETNIRRVFVDNTTTPVTFWVGNNHRASIVRLEPAD